MANIKRQLETPEKSKSSPVPKKANVRDWPAAEHGDGVDAVPPPWFAQFLVRFNLLEERIDSKVINRLEEIARKSDENEEKISACCLQLDDLVTEVKSLKEEKEDILMKLDDLENRARRCNLVLHGIAENRKETCHETVEAFFSDFVGVPQSEYLIERCHRTPTVRKETNDGEEKSKPRIIHVALSTFSSKEKLRKACIAKLKLDGKFRNQKVFVSEDFSRRVLNMRKERMDKLKSLKEAGKKPFFMYPARLAYRNKDGKLIFV